MSMPVMRIELEGMKQTLLVALTQHTALIDTDLQDAVESYCTEGNLRSTIKTQVKQHLDAAVAEAVSEFFRWGEGKPVVREAVRLAILKNLGEPEHD